MIKHRFALRPGILIGCALWALLPACVSSSTGNDGANPPGSGGSGTSPGAMQKLSGNAMGFGGDLTFGKADGLSGADEICRQIAETSMPGAGGKGWRAFLSATAGGPGGAAVHAKDRLGDGPWYDRRG